MEWNGPKRSARPPNTYMWLPSIVAEWKSLQRAGLPCAGAERRGGRVQRRGWEGICSHHLRFLRFLQLRVEIWEEKERADLCTDKGPCHGAGIQLVNVIGKAVRLSRKRNEVKGGIKEGGGQ